MTVRPQQDGDGDRGPAPGPRQQLRATPASCSTSYANLGVDHQTYKDVDPLDLYGDYQGVRSSTQGGSECHSIPSQQHHVVVTLFSRRHVGLLVSLAFASVLTSCLKRGLLPLLKSELRLSAAQFDAAQILLILPWACTFFLGFCSDALPIFGRHRKPYMVLGWTVTSLALFTLAIVNYIQEYDQRISNEDPSLGAESRNHIRNVYVALLGLASFGGILSVVVAEIYVIQQSRSEPLRQRGHMVGTFLMTQFGFEMVGQLITDLVIFRVTKLGLVPLYSFRNVVLFFVFYALVPIPTLLYFFDERVGDADLRQPSDLQLQKPQYITQPTVDDVDDEDSEFAQSRIVAVLGDQPLDDDDAPRSRLRAHVRALFETLKRGSTLKIVRFLALFIFFSEFTFTYPDDMLDKWCGITLKLESSGKILAEAMYFIAIATWKLLFVDLDWRRLAAGTLVLFFLMPQAVYYFLVSYDVGRSAQAYTVIKSMRGLLRAIMVLLEVLIAVEITPRGSEGATLGLVVSTGTVMRLLGTTCSNQVGKLLVNASSTTSGTSAKASIDVDSAGLRDHIASMLAALYLIRLFALFGLKHIPRQKKSLQAELLNEGRAKEPRNRPSRGNALRIVLLLLVALAIVSAVNTLETDASSTSAACATGGATGTSGC